MSTFEGTSPIFRSALRAAMETMQFQIAQMGKAETKFFFISMVRYTNIYDIFVLKENYLLIIKVFFLFIT